MFDKEMTQEVKDKLTAIVAPLKPLKEAMDKAHEVFADVGFPKEDESYTYSAQWDYDHAKWDYKRSLRFVFTAAAEAFFKMNYGIESICWYQYSAYYDDSCYFDNALYVGLICVNTNQPEYGSHKTGSQFMRDAARWFHSLFTEGELLMLFGDHCIVQVKAKGATISAYDGEN